MKRYSEDHEWVEESGKELYRVGISDYAQEQMGDVVYVELPEIGSTVTAGEACATIESVKAASEIFSPLTGTVSEINENLESAPESVNEDAEGEAWLFVVNSAADITELMTEQEYQEFCSNLEE